MIGGGKVDRRHVVLAATSGICFFAAARASDLVAVQSNGLTALWAANAVLLGILLRWGRSTGSAVAICLGAFAASVISSRFGGQPLPLALVFACANLTEALLAATILRWLCASPGPLARVNDVLALLVACVLAPLGSGVMAGCGLWIVNGIPFGAGFVGWYLAAVLGLALVTPGIVTAIDLTEAARQKPLCARQVSEVILLLAAVAVTAIFVFYVARHSSLFLLMPVILLATFRLRQFGAVAAVGIVALISAIATGHGIGPIAATDVGASGQTIYLQIFLALIFASTLPVAAALAERDARADEAHLIADHFKAVVENASDVIFRTDRAGRWTYLNPAWETLLGYPVSTSLGCCWTDWIDPAEHGEIQDWAQPVFTGEVVSTRRMLRLHNASGSARWMELAIRALSDADGLVIGTTGTLRDVHERKRLEERVMGAKRLAEERERAATLLASTDELTGLCNRRAFLIQLDRQMSRTREDDVPLAVAIFDVDYFKSVNDSHGHAVGDRVLQRVAARAAGIVRGGDLVGRLGGEEFGVLMPRATLGDAATVAERLRAAMREECEAGLPDVTVSIGIAARNDGQSAGELLAAADEALYRAKDSGRDRVRIAA